jgi:hypothetical protein
MTTFAGLVTAHAILATLGFVGLIATTVMLLLQCRQFGPDAVIRAIRTWRASARIFGPVLGLGLLVGLWLALAAHISLTSSWLLMAYALIVLAMTAQAGIMIPWQRRAQRAVEAGALVSTRGIVTVVVVFTVAYVGLILLMLVRPS